jgi:hypothetical protein
MQIFLHTTANLGDFLNAMPVLSGLSKNHGKLDFIIRSEMVKFKGIKEFLMYQDIFNSVNFHHEVFMYNTVTIGSWTREDKNIAIRPIETCRYENWVRDNFGHLTFDVDDDFTIKVPKLNVQVDDEWYVGDRWSEGTIDFRRATNNLKHLTNCRFIDYNNDLLTNAYILKNLKKPFISSLTGISVLADLLNVEAYVIWKAEDWNPEFRNGDNINWDNGKDITKIFEKHFYANRKMKLLHERDLQTIL